VLDLRGLVDIYHFEGEYFMNRSLLSWPIYLPTYLPIYLACAFREK
jgi:hypothetical protein